MFTTVPFERTGEAITSIKALKNGKYKVSLGQTSFLLNQEAYVEFAPYIGKKCNQEDIDRLKELEKEGPIYSFARHLVIRENISPKRVYQRILKKAENKKALAYKIFNSLKEEGLLKEEDFARNYVEEKQFQGYGPRKIKEDLLKEGISPSLAASFSLKEKEEEAVKYLPLLEKKFSYYPYGERIRKGEEFLLRKGYSHSLSHKIALKIKENKRELERYCKKRYTLLRKKYEMHYNEKDAKEKTKSLLLKEGFSLSLIQKEESQYGQNYRFKRW